MTTYHNSNLTTPPTGFRLQDTSALFEAVQNANGSSAASGIVAAGSSQSGSTVLTSVINEVDTVAASSGVMLPSTTGKRNTPYQTCIIYNNGANTLTVYGNTSDSATINGTAASTGVSIPAGGSALFISAKASSWFAFGVGAPTSTGALTVSGNITETQLGSGFIQKAGANGRAGTFTLNGTTPVTVANTTTAITDAIVISLNTVGGTVGVQPHIATITAGTGFTVIGTAGDTSVYNYSMFGTN